MASPGNLSTTVINDIVATTLHSRSGDIADNVTDNNALLLRLKQRGKIKTFSGGDVILQELNYSDSATNTAMSYSGYETLNVGVNSPISASRWDIKQYAASVTMSGLDMLQNSGKEAVIDLIDARMEIAEAQLANRIALDIYGDGTGNGGKNITGLQAIVADAPTSGTVGSIDRATWTFWQNQVFDATSDGTATSATTIQSNMNGAAVECVRGRDRPDLIIMDNVYYKFYLASLQAIQRVTSDGDAKMVGAGFPSLKYYGAGMSSDVVLDGGIGGNCPASHAYFLNTNYLHWRPHAERNFVPIGGERQAVNQDAIVKLIGWAGNLTCSSARLQSVYKE